MPEKVHMCFFYQLPMRGESFEREGILAGFISFWFNLTKNSLTEVELTHNVVLISDAQQVAWLYTHTFLYSFPWFITG